MRNNSGDDEKRNNLRDPTLREKQDKPDKGRPEPVGGQSTTEMGSGERKSGQEGEDG
jgi:hypothetical protein